MKKILTIGLIVMVALMSITGCSSTSPAEKEAAKAAAPKPEIIDSSYQAWGKEIPDWVTMSRSALEQKDEYEDKYVFKIESPEGESKQGVQMYADNFQAQSELARLISTRVRDKFAGAAAGDMDQLETYMEQVVQVVSESQYSGYRKEDEAWVQRRYFESDGSVDREVYQYMMLYTIPQDVVDEKIEQALENAGGEADSEEKTTAKDRVKEAFESGL